MYVLPPKPQRKEIQAPQDLQDYAQIINYYEHLVEEWEQWSAVVEEMVKWYNAIASVVTAYVRCQRLGGFIFDKRKILL